MSMIFLLVVQHDVWPPNVVGRHMELLHTTIFLRIPNQLVVVPKLEERKTVFSLEPKHFLAFHHQIFTTEKLQKFNFQFDFNWIGSLLFYFRCLKTTGKVLACLIKNTSFSYQCCHFKKNSLAMEKKSCQECSDNVDVFHDIYGPMIYTPFKVSQGKHALWHSLQWMMQKQPKFKFV